MRNNFPAIYEGGVFVCKFKQGGGGTRKEIYIIEYKCQFSLLLCHQVFMSLAFLSCTIWWQGSSRLIANSHFYKVYIL